GRKLAAAVHDEAPAVGGPALDPVLGHHSGYGLRLPPGDGIEVVALVRSDRDDELAVGRDAVANAPIPLRGERTRLTTGEVHLIKTVAVTGLAARDDERLAIGQPVGHLDLQTRARGASRLADAGGIQNHLRIAGRSDKTERPLPVGRQRGRAAFPEPGRRRAVR